MTTKLTTSNKAFTLIELLITISIIVLLVSILTIALTSARTAAKIAETQSRLTALSAATIRFKEDIGYYPPVLDNNRNLLNSIPPFPDTSYRRNVQDWYSITSPAEFLIGYGDRNDDGYGRLPNSVPGDDDFDEIPRFGIRHPSMDGVWRATDPLAGDGDADLWELEDRAPFTRGKLYGPYLEVENEQMFGRLVFESDGTTPLIDPVTGQTKIFYPEDPGYDPSGPMVIVDSWGTPIRYYRLLYPLPQPLDQTRPHVSIAKFYPPSNNYDRPTLSDYFVLRPSVFEQGKVVDATRPDFMDGLTVVTGDTSTTFELQSGQFSYFSAGPDQQSNRFIRADLLGLPDNDDEDATDEANLDNLVEVGP